LILGKVGRSIGGRRYLGSYCGGTAGGRLELGRFPLCNLG
jgi:hypothetical protein